MSHVPGAAGFGAPRNTPIWGSLAHRSYKTLPYQGGASAYCTRSCGLLASLPIIQHRNGTGPARGAGCGGGCTGAKDAGRVSAVAANTASETPEGWDASPIAQQETGALLMKGPYETVAGLSIRARVQWRWSASPTSGDSRGRQAMISGTCKNVPRHSGRWGWSWCSQR